MLNKSKLFLNVLCDELTEEYKISKESFNANTTLGTGLKEVLNARADLGKYGLTSDDVISYLGENLGYVPQDESNITNFMINEIIDSGTKEEKQLVLKYIKAKEDLSLIEDTLNSRIKSYKDKARDFYSGISNTSNLINKYINTSVEE